jgi:hypothetical protein
MSYCDYRNNMLRCGVLTKERRNMMLAGLPMAGLPISPELQPREDYTLRLRLNPT